jgi:hypothetical protein
MLRDSGVELMQGVCISGFLLFVLCCLSGVLSRVA